MRGEVLGLGVLGLGNCISVHHCGLKRKIDLEALICSKIMITNDPCSETELSTLNLQYEYSSKQLKKKFISDNHEDC